MADEIWRLPYSAQQLQNAVTNQVPRVNAARHWERWDIATGAWVDTGVLADAGFNDGTVALTTTWTYDSTNGWWTQVISIPNTTNRSVVDLRFTAAQLTQLMSDGCTCAPFAVNDGGTITVYALGAEPTTAMSVYYTMLGGVTGTAAVSQNSPLSFNGAIPTINTSPISEVQEG